MTIELLTVDAAHGCFFVRRHEPEGRDADVRAWSDAGLVVRVLRGRKMRTWARLFDEMAAAFQFPEYFGENLDALHDCLTDFAWLPPQKGYVVLVAEADELLLDEPPESLTQLIEILRSSCEYWNNPVAEGQPWDRPAIPFHVVLHGGDSREVARRWALAGASVRDI